ncbi:MAG TPA: protease inhibitor I42 family protein, partial [Acidimicrobiales bacterium]|nr:protease inhibitor I42 family protein [Acidimicrobiales bacterium]
FFEIELSDCFSCGYSWQFLAPAPNYTIVAYQGETDRPNQAPPGSVGGNGTAEFTFEAMGTGQTSVNMGYFAPSGGQPSQTFTVTFVIH